jgi:hypothetical protein
MNNMCIVYTGIEVGPTKLITGKSTLALTRYANNMNIALLLVHPETHETHLHATINIANVLDDSHAWIKDYSENEGVLESLIDAYQVKLLTSMEINEHGTLAYFVKFRGSLQHEAMDLDFKEAAA